jgi:hypothetical protein
VCCFTHNDPAYPGELAASDQWRCRCGTPSISGQCQRKATGEDLLCDTCRGQQFAPPRTADDATYGGGGAAVTDLRYPGRAEREGLINRGPMYERDAASDWLPPGTPGMEIDAGLDYMREQVQRRLAATPVDGEPGKFWVSPDQWRRAINPDDLPPASPIDYWPPPPEGT